jgi:uncharacterized protein with HEPN domain
MSDDVRQVVHAMLAAIDGIDDTIRDCTLEEYVASWRVKHAVERGIEIISEASRRLPKDIRDSQPTIDWRQIRGIGNILRHEYDAIVDDVVFRAANDSLPALKAALAAIAAELDVRNEGR